MAMDDLLLQTSQLLARVTAHAAVVVGPQAEAVVIRGAHLALLQPRVVLAVVILSNGAVEKQVVFLDEDASDADVAIGERPARANCSTVTASATSRRATDDAVPDDAIAERLARAVARRARAATSACTTAEPLYVGGASRLAAEPDAFSGTTVARLIELLEHHVVLASLMREMLGPGLTVRIGSENASADLQEVFARARAVSRRRRAGGYRRRPRPDPHGLPQGAGRGRDRLPTARPATLPVTVDRSNLNPHG